MTIGTAKPTRAEMEGVTHYFVNSHSIHSPLSAGEFAREADQLLATLFLASDTVILVGGSGLFIKSLVEGIDDLPGNEAVRKKWNTRFEEDGLSVLQQELAMKDPEYFATVDKNNPVRLIRALEVIELTGQKYSSLRLGKKKSNAFETNYFIVNHDREKLYERINRRVELMMEKGLEEEARSLFGFKANQALNTVGYKELFDFFDGKISKTEAIEYIKQNTRRFAKRQITWFKSLKNAKWGTPEELHEEIIRQFIKN